MVGQVLRVATIAMLVAGGAYFTLLRAQSIDVLQNQVHNLEQWRRAIEASNIVTDVAVLKEAMMEVKILGRSIAAAIAVQLVLQFKERKNR